MKERVHQLERDNAEMRAIITSFSGILPVDQEGSSIGQLARPAPTGTNHLYMLERQELQTSPPAIFDLGYPSDFSLRGKEDRSRDTGDPRHMTSQGLQLVEPNRVSVQVQDQGNHPTATDCQGDHAPASQQAARTLSLSNEDEPPELAPVPLPRASNSISLAQAALIIQGALADTLEDAQVACPLDERPQDVPNSDPSTLEDVSTSEIFRSGAQAEAAPSTFDVVRLIRDRHFDFVNDLSCPIFQTIVMVSTGQGHVTVAVRGEDGNALTSSELWKHLHGYCRVSLLLRLCLSWSLHIYDRGLIGSSPRSV